MCDYCDYESEKNEIFQDQVGDYYLDVNTYEWDEYDDDYIHRRLYINYCPYCGRNLYLKEKEKDKYERIIREALKEEEQEDSSKDEYDGILERMLREYKLSNPYPTYYPTNQQASYVPACCRSCPKHPSNGGDGICNCTAPLFDSNNPWRITC